jgi:glucose/arabinose dehydrogenase
MKKIGTVAFIIVGLIVLGIIAVAGAGMYKFNYLPDQPGYDVDGNRIEAGGTTMLEEDERISDGPITPTDYRELPESEAQTTEVVRGLDAPWAFVWLPNGDILVTERFGTLRRVSADGETSTIVGGVPAVFSAGQGGLLDVTIHPNFVENNLVYLSYAHGSNEGNRLRVARAELLDGALQNLEVIFEVAETKPGGQHFGSRFAWLPDNTLLFSVGDGGNPPTEYNGELIREQAQNLNAHLGKVIRINDDGSIPNDNPFVGRPDVNPEIYSYGHRNIQGIAYDTSRDRVVASEHGSLGGDELNVIMGSENYGWPVVTYGTEYDVFRTEIGEGQSRPAFVDPLVAWTPTVAPSSVVAYSGEQYNAAGDTFMAAMLLRSSATLAAYATRPAGSLIRLLTDEAGDITSQELIRLGDVRVRSIAQGPDNYLYALTDTTDRQSRPGTNAGAIVRVLGWE